MCTSHKLFICTYILPKNNNERENLQDGSMTFDYSISQVYITMLISPLKGGSQDKTFRIQEDFTLPSLLCVLSFHRREYRRASLLEKCRFSKEIGRNWFTKRVVDDWNRLSHQVVSAQIIRSFKKRLDDFRDGNEKWM